MLEPEDPLEIIDCDSKTHAPDDADNTPSAKPDAPTTTPTLVTESSEPETSNASDVHPVSGAEMDSVSTLPNTARPVLGTSLNREAIASNVTEGANAIAQLMSEGFARLGMHSYGIPTERLLAPPALRHIHSTPLDWRRSSLYQSFNDEEDLPPPVPLDPFQRSTSTPSSFRQRSVNSAFGAVGRGAFASSLYGGTSYVDSGSAFGPVRYYAYGLEDMERTSIEVTDMTSANTSLSLATSSADMPVAPKKPSFKAKKYLANFPPLRRRRRRAFNGRKNPVPAASVSSGSAEGKSSEGSESASALETAVTVVTEPATNPNNDSLLSEGMEVSAMVRASGVVGGNSEFSRKMCSLSISGKNGRDKGSDPDEEDEIETRITEPYHALDSDADDDGNYPKIETSLGESPSSVPSPVYQQILDDPSPSPSVETSPVQELKTPNIRIQVSNAKERTTSNRSERGVKSPSPTQIGREGSAITARSIDSETASPGTTRSSNTGSSSGHTTQGTASSHGSALQSGLSTISETDREVMEANKQGQKRRSLLNSPVTSKVENDVTSIHSSSTSSSATLHGYLALGGSPASLRDGAVNVPGDRSLALSSRRSGRTSSAGTLGSVSLAHTSSSGSSEEPPTFVSYFDREGNSDLMSVREATESSSPREGGADREEREGSPAELLCYPSVVFQISAPSEKQPTVVRPGRNRGRLDKSQLPPRSPAKGLRPASTSTPPPRSSVSPMYQQLSPPRNIVEKYLPTQAEDLNISRPHACVMRTSLSSTALSGPLNTEEGAPEDRRWLEGDAFPLQGTTYEDNGIEVLKTDSKDEHASSKAML